MGEKRFSFKIDSTEFGARVSKSGGVATSDGNSTQWALFKRADVELVYGPLESWRQSARGSQLQLLARELTGWRPRRSETPGQRFSDSPEIRITRGHVLVRQDSGMDV